MAADRQAERAAWEEYLHQTRDARFACGGDYDRVEAWAYARLISRLEQAGALRRKTRRAAA